MGLRILGIESSCDDTAAAVCEDCKILSNIVSSQLNHAKYGGVIPELASRLHLAQIAATVRAALAEANVLLAELDAVGFTAGPGLMGALMVGTSFAKGFALALDLPLVEANHMEGHLLSVFLEPPGPAFPYLCLTVSGGHTQLTIVRDYLDAEVIGKTIDDAAGEAFDKTAKLLGLAYPGGPLMDKLAREGDPHFYAFPEPKVGGLDFSFSGLKTAVLYFLRDRKAEDEQFIETHKADLAASIQHRIVGYLLDKLFKASAETGIKRLAIVGGVSANSRLREFFAARCAKAGCEGFIPPFKYCTDNAAMIAFAAHHKYLAGRTTDHSVTAFAS